jgi:hypothetical protein
MLPYCSVFGVSKDDRTEVRGELELQRRINEGDRAEPLDEWAQAYWGSKTFEA